MGAKRLRETLESFCAQGDRAALAAEWDAEKNAPLTPEQVTIGSHQEVFWRCPHGHNRKAVVYSRTGARPSGCPVCAGSRWGAIPVENPTAQPFFDRSNTVFK